MSPEYQELTDRERTWITAQLEAAGQFVAKHSPADEASPRTLGALDRAFAAWLDTNESETAGVNAAINAVGVAFGSLLVSAAGFAWAIATDEHRTALAVVALPGTADILVFPANFVAKRWERRQSFFLQPSFEEMVRRDRRVAQTQRAPAAAKRPWWKRLGGDA